MDPESSSAERALAEQVFSKHRPLLFTIAYEITGTVADAEDVLQESHLRWSSTDPEGIGNHRAYLAKIVTRQALNVLRSTRRRREDYVGPWLPEPVATLPDVAEDAVLAESLSFAMLVVLESLSPDQRAVFILREVFDFPYDEIAEAMGKTTASVRQLAHRAKDHVAGRTPRFDVDHRKRKDVTDRFVAATMGGDVQALMDVLAPGAVLLSDGGGKVSAARRPVVGAVNVARFLLGLAGKPLPAMRVELSLLNAMPAILIYSGGRLDLAVVVEAGNDHVTGLYLVRNPDKLGAAATTRRLSR
ncbi:MAG TPA: RNA polymerase sigma-70 factor [Arthrobacter sp.]|nr:RNA polymerase sigma-70 factor [Arthrobacter sp.]